MKKIAVTCDIEQIAHIQKCNYYVNSEYLEFVRRAGCTPFIVADAMDVDDIATMMDGLLLTGGRDLNPISYNADLEQNGSTGSCLARDNFEKKLYRAFVARGKPVFGICRGWQVIAVMNKMRLCQEVHHVSGNHVLHNQAAVEIDGTNPVHITLNQGLMTPIMGQDKVPVNSFHHQGVVIRSEIGKFVQKYENLVGFALSNDKTPVVEAGVFEVDTLIPNVSIKVGGVQYHPERLIRNTKSQLHLRFFRYIMGLMKLDGQNNLVDVNVDNNQTV